jgi:hypothetical protein
VISVPDNGDEESVAIALIYQSKERIKRLRDEIEDEAAGQQWPRSVLWMKYGKAMVEAGKKTLTVGDHIIEAGLNETKYCLCHATTKMSECDTVGDVAYRTAAPTPYINVKPKPVRLALGKDEK